MLNQFLSARDRVIQVNHADLCYFLNYQLSTKQCGKICRLKRCKLASILFGLMT
jgi:hypothetical protein